MKLYSGIDLHSNNSVVSVLDETDRIVYERRLDNDFEKRGQIYFPDDQSRSSAVGPG
jgi:hypothetical protein